MNLILIIIIGIHGVIHLFGFLKSFGYSEFKAISQAISKPSGILWLTAFILFAVSGILLIIKNNYWWLFGIIAVVVSQMLIILFWKDARFGTLPNLIILVSVVIAYAGFNFTGRINTEISRMFLDMEDVKNDTISHEMIKDLPVPVENWLRSSGIIDKKHIRNVYLKQEVLMKMKPGQKGWYKAEAEQYFTIKPPAFNWSVNLEMNPIFRVAGRDKFESGKGEILIKVLSIFPVVNVRDNFKIDQGALQRYLAEIVWFPSAALSPYISWESIDDLSAKATMTHNGTSGSGIFFFNEKGDFIKFSAMRYKDADKGSELKEWIVEVIKSRIINGVRIPVEVKATWKLDDGEWTWLKIIITGIHYNIEKMPVTDK